MKALIQRVERAHVVVAGQTVGQIGQGLLVLLCVEKGDTEALADKLLAKLLRLRIFSDDAGKMNRSVQDVALQDQTRLSGLQALDGAADQTVQAGGLLVVSQFTLAADISGGNRPSFGGAAAPDEGRRLYEYFVREAKLKHPIVQTGQFATEMKVHMVGDGPVTIPMQVSGS